MIKKVVLAAMLAASMIAIPQAAAANGCGLNCVRVVVTDANGHELYSYWDCPDQMECDANP